MATKKKKPVGHDWRELQRTKRKGHKKVKGSTRSAGPAPTELAGPKPAPAPKPAPPPPPAAKKAAPQKTAASTSTKQEKPKQEKPQQQKKPPKQKEWEKNPSAVTRCGTVALVGRPNVGKSSLMNAILGQKIAATTHKPQTTRRQLRGVATTGDTQFIFVDTPGIHMEKGGLFSYMLEQAKGAAEDVDVLCFLVEASPKGSGINAEDEAALKLLSSGEKAKPAILIINKIDMLQDKSVLLPLLQAWHDKGSFQAIIPVSAHKRDGIKDVLDEVRKLLPEGAFVFPPDSMTDASERDIAAELIREKVMLELQQEIPYRAAVVVEHFDESRRDDERKPLVHIAAQIVVEKDSQKAVVIGKGGSRIKVIGQRARAELEHLLDCQVHLELFVKVEPNWTATSAGLKKLGYTKE